MNRNQEKLQKLAYVPSATIGRLEAKRHCQGAGGVPPLVSRMLQEARELGVVKIMVCPPVSQGDALVEQLRRSTSIRDGVLVEDGRDDDATNQLLSQGAVQLLWQLRSRRLGIGWGHLIGQLVTWLEEHPQLSSTVTDICPLVATPASPPETTSPTKRAAHRPAAGAAPTYLPAALPDSLEEKQLLCSLGN